MKVCNKCLRERRDEEFRRKTSGPRAGYVFPQCIPCEADDDFDAKANELRARGFEVTKSAAPASEMPSATTPETR